MKIYVSLVLAIMLLLASPARSLPYHCSHFCASQPTSTSNETDSSGGSISNTALVLIGVGIGLGLIIGYVLFTDEPLKIESDIFTQPVDNLFFFQPPVASKSLNNDWQGAFTLGSTSW